MITPKISTKGSRFHVPNGNGLKVLAELSAIIVGANPKLSKSWYREEWNEDSESKSPDCFSLNGINPSENSALPQNDICVSCPQNAWGSKTTPTGVKVKACADQKRLAVVLSEKSDGDVYLLQVAPASLKNLNAYQKELEMRGIVPEITKTKVSFVSNAPYPKLRFSFGGFNNDLQQANVDKLLGSNDVKLITGELTVRKGQQLPASSYGFTDEDGFTLTQTELGGSNE